MADMLKIGELAARAGLSRDTIRFYERETLLPQASRTPAGYRLYSPDMVQRLHFIKQAQALGFCSQRSATFWRAIRMPRHVGA